jgi:hypothetical protein
MGKLRRRFIVTFQHYQGDWTLPLTESRPNQDAMSVVVQTTAILGQQCAGLFGVKAARTGVVSLIGVHARATVPAGFDIGLVANGQLYGIRNEVEVFGVGSRVRGDVYGETIEIFADANAVINGLIYGLYINNYVLTTPGGYAFIRCDENGDQTIQECMAFYMGGTSDSTFFLFLSPGTRTGWASGGARATAQDGWLRVSLQGIVRYIRLWT